MDKDLVKLAEVAGYDISSSVSKFSGYKTLSKKDSTEWSFMNKWKPHKDIAQAMEVLEGWRLLDDLSHYMISSPRLHSCIKYYDLDLYCYDSDGFIYTVTGQHETLSQAICKAVLKALK